MLPSVGPTESSSETLRRVARTMVPPPDVTHHTHHRTGGQQHDSSSLSTTLPFGSLNASISQAVQSTPKQPQGILKDAKRSNSSASGSHTYSSLPLQQQQQLYSIHNPSPIPSDQYVAGPSGLLMGAYDPPASSSLASYNVSVGYTDSDGHLV
ncbi:AGAP010748-PA [Anopheles gambiae str. PEST]|uniref:AGAP010748-PA n=1 Tax=Anopheles gambiae TaxID=7165 RepID=Q7Q1Z7_ANOGA|nr:AGAP010748-PA [Anopheles gambiae str. PEST]